MKGAYTTSDASRLTANAVERTRFSRLPIPFVGRKNESSGRKIQGRVQAKSSDNEFECDRRGLMLGASAAILAMPQFSFAEGESKHSKFFSYTSIVYSQARYSGFRYPDCLILSPWTFRTCEDFALCKFPQCIDSALLLLKAILRSLGNSHSINKLSIQRASNVVLRNYFYKLLMIFWWGLLKQTRSSRPTWKLLKRHIPIKAISRI